MPMLMEDSIPPEANDKFNGFDIALVILNESRIVVCVNIKSFKVNAVNGDSSMLSFNCKNYLRASANPRRGTGFYILDEFLLVFRNSDASCRLWRITVYTSSFISTA